MFAKTTPLSYKIGFWATAVAACLWTSSATLTMLLGIDLEPVAGLIVYLLFAALSVALFGLTWTITQYIKRRLAIRTGQRR